MEMMKTVSTLRAGEKVAFGDRTRVVKRVRLVKGDWSHATIYFKDGGSTWLSRDLKVKVIKS